MTRGLIFWILMLIWLIFGIFAFAGTDDVRIRAWVPLGSSLLQFILFALLGWQSYGPAIKG